MGGEGKPIQFQRKFEIKLTIRLEAFKQIKHINNARTMLDTL